MNEYEFICQLCEGKQLHDPAKGHVPPGWAMKRINGEVILLCDVHANPCHWFGGPSPAIKEMYKKNSVRRLQTIRLGAPFWHKEFSIIKQDWQFINSFADWFSAFGTIAAVIVALYLARQDKRIRLHATAGHRVIVSQGSQGPFPQYLAIRITNVGHRDVQVIGIGWRIGLFKKTYADQTIIRDGISSPLPIRLRDGDEACYYFPLFTEIEWFREFIQKMLLPHLRWNLWFTHVRIYTSVGKVFRASLEQGLKKRIIEYVKQNPMLKPRV